MKRFPILVIAAATLMSTAAVSASLVAAGTNASKPEAVVQSAALEQLKAQASSSMTTWQRPL